MNGPFAKTRLSGAKIPRLAPSSVKTAVQESPSGDTCPRCQATLTDPHGLGLCPRCGFCRSLEEARKAAIADQVSALEATAPTLVASWRALRLLPASVWAVLVITLCLLPVCYYADRKLPPSSSVRMLWTTVQMLIGVVAIFIAQLWALLLLRPRDRSLTFADVIFPAKLWRRTCLNMPETTGPLALCGSGCLAILTAMFWMGGWSWWLKVDTTPDLPTRNAARVEDSNWTDRFKQLKTATATAQVPDRSKPVNAATTPRSALPVDLRPTTQCVVIGYVPNDDGSSISGLVLATLREGKLAYAGTVTSGVGKNESPDLLKKLASLRSNAPLLNDVDVKAVWVLPEMFCEVHQSGNDERGLLVAPRFKAVIDDQ